MTQIAMSNDYQLVPVWPNPDEKTKDELIQFWLREGVMNEGMAQERSNQLLTVAFDCDGTVVAASTVVRAYIEQLGLKCFYYRSYVSQQHRVVGLRSIQLGKSLLQKSLRFLNQRYLIGHDADIVGVFLEIENQMVMQRKNELVWQTPAMNLLYFGTNRRGHHCRVGYFDGARIP